MKTGNILKLGCKHYRAMKGMIWNDFLTPQEAFDFLLNLGVTVIHFNI